jgi:hypothetical protein
MLTSPNRRFIISELAKGSTQRGPDAAGRADRTKDIGPVVALIAGGRGPRAALGPDTGQGSLLADAGLVLPPELKRLSAGMLW